MEIARIAPHGTMFHFKTGESWDLNCFLIERENRLYLIDTGRGCADAQEMRHYIISKYSGKQLIVINTPYHWDHTWGNGVFSDCMIIANSLCPELYKAEFSSLAGSVRSAGEPTLCLPSVTIDSRLHIAFDKLLLFTAKGHTPDGLCVLDEIDGTLYVGDCIGDKVDMPLPELDDTVQDYAHTLEVLERLQFDKLLSGHNVPLTKSFLSTIKAELKKGL